MIHSETKTKIFRKRKTGGKGMKRKVLSVMLCAAMVVSMTACGGSSSSNTAETTAAATEIVATALRKPREQHRAGCF